MSQTFTLGIGQSLNNLTLVLLIVLANSSLAPTQMFFINRLNHEALLLIFMFVLITKPANVSFKIFFSRFADDLSPTLVQPVAGGCHNRYDGTDYYGTTYTGKSIRCYRFNIYGKINRPLRPHLKKPKVRRILSHRLAFQHPVGRHLLHVAICLA